MGLIYCGLQRSLVYVVICLKRSATLTGPEIYKAFASAGPVNSCIWERGYLFLPDKGGHVHFRPEYLPPIDVTFEIQVGIGSTLPAVRIVVAPQAR